MSPEVPRNIKLGQIRRTVGLLSHEAWHRLGEDERAAVDALSLHVWFRARQSGHSAFEGDDCVFLTSSWMQNLLRAVEARKTGEKTAAAAISFLEEKNLLVDTGRTKKPRRRAERIARAERFQKRGSTAHEGGKEAQPSPHHSYWWRLFRVPALTKVREVFKPLRAYGRFEDVPQHLASLSAFLRRQGLIPSRRAPSSFNPRSVQWVSRTAGHPDVPLVVAENAMERLFDLEAAPCRDHDSPALLAGWRELVAEVGYCQVCGEVVWIRLGGLCGKTRAPCGKAPPDNGGDDDEGDKRCGSLDAATAWLHRRVAPAGQAGDQTAAVLLSPRMYQHRPDG